MAAMDQLSFQKLAEAFTSTSFLMPVTALVAYDLAARSALKTWIAVEQLQDAPAPATDEDLAREKRRHRIMAALSAVAFISVLACSEFALFSQSYSELLNTFFTIVTAASLFVCHLSAFAKITKLDHAVYRRRNGFLSFKVRCTTWQSKLAALLVVALGAANTYLTLADPTNVAQRMISIGSVIVATTSKCNQRTVSIRNFTIVFLIYEAIVLATGVGLTFMLKKDASVVDPFTRPAGWEAALAESRPVSIYSSLNRVFGVFIPAFYASPVGQYLAICLRFDYRQSRTSFSSSVVALEEVPAKKMCGSNTSPGLVVPAHSSLTDLIPAAQRYYYNAGVMVIATCYLLLAPLVHSLLKDSLFAEIAQKQYSIEGLEAVVFSMLALFVTIPAMALTIGIMGKIHGDGKLLWQYSESWATTPFGEAKATEAEADAKAGFVLPESEKAPLLSFQEAIES